MDVCINMYENKDPLGLLFKLKIVCFSFISGSLFVYLLCVGVCLSTCVYVCLKRSGLFNIAASPDSSQFQLFFGHLEKIAIWEKEMSSNFLECSVV